MTVICLRCGREVPTANAFRDPEGLASLPARAVCVRCVVDVVSSHFGGLATVGGAQCPDHGALDYLDDDGEEEAGGD